MRKIILIFILICLALFIIGCQEQGLVVTAGEENIVTDYSGLGQYDNWVGKELIIRGVVLFDPAEIGGETVVLSDEFGFMMHVRPMPGHVMKQGEIYVIKGTFMHDETLGYFLEEQEYTKEDAY